jgi:hypothetical protein
MDTTLKHSISITFEEIKLPPFQDILVLAKNSPHGIIGITKSFELLAPNGFEIIKVEHEKVEAVLINKRILAKICKEKVIEILREKVFVYISDGEILKVDFKVTISCLIE